MKKLSIASMMSILVLAFMFPQITRAASLELPLNIGEVSVARDSEVVTLEGYGTLREPGAPRLPARIYAVAIPPGAVVQSVETVSDRTTFMENVSVAPAQPPRAISNQSVQMDLETQKKYEATRQRIYSSDELYPAHLARVVRTGGFRKYNIVDVQVCPVQYSPALETLSVHQDLTLIVHYILPETPVQPLLDSSPRMEVRASDIIANYGQAQSWYPQQSAVRGLHDYVIVTTSDLAGAVSSLVQWEMIKGRNVEVVPVNWIYSNYTGYDNAEKIRNFLRDKYPSEQWGIEDVCFVGTMADVPMRNIDADPDTDFYYAELSLPDSSSWDANGNHSYLGSGDSCDFYAEVNVGRIPWSDSETVMAICEKTVNYEMNDDPAFKQNILLLGAYFWNDTDNAVLMEAKVDQPWMSDWTMTRMYEQNADYYSTYPCDQELLHYNAVSEWANGTYAFVNYAGHGSPTSCHIYGIGAPAFIEDTDCTSLSDTYPAIVFADACSNSSTQEISIAARMIEHGAVGFVGATRVAYGCPGWSGPNDGSSQSLDYYFTTGVTSGEYTQGAAHQRGLYEVYQMNGWDSNELEICEWTLYGNPNLGMATVNSSDGRIMMDAENYGVDTTVIFNVRDLDLNLNPDQVESVTITLETSGGDTESLILHETDINTAVFSGTMDLVQGTPVTGNQWLEADHGQTVTATYIDADDGLGGVNVPKTDTAMVDLQNPMISDVQVTEITHESAIITWTTDEPATSMVTFGEGVPGTTEYQESLSTDHIMTLTDLSDCTSFNFYLECSDEAGNTTLDDNGGSYYDFTTWELVVLVDENMDSDPGWSYENQWAWGVPQGNSGDPSSGNTGDNVIGYNLAGNYTNNMSESYCTTTSFDCTGTTEVILSYYYWLGVESSTYDHASLEVSGDNGSTWTQIWDHTGGSTSSTDWTFAEFDISGMAAGNSSVQIRWIMGSTDSSVTFCGWNIDDVQVAYALPCESPCINDGDVDQNGQVTSGDAQLAFMIALGMMTPDEEEACAADCNGDGDVTAGDAQAIFMKALGSGTCADS